MLRASSQRWIWVLIGSVVFVALGTGIALGNRTGAVATVIGVVIALFFGFCAAVALRQILSPGSLLISRTSIVVSAPGRATVFDLSECGSFRTWRNPSRGNVIVVFDYQPDGDTDLALANRELTGASRSLPDTYGVAAQELAAMLESVRIANR